MLIKARPFWSLIFLGLPCISPAQNSDSSQVKYLPTRIYSIVEKDLLIRPKLFQSPDTILKGTEETLLPRNMFYAFQGIPGTPASPLLYEPGQDPYAGIRTHIYDIYLFRPEDVRYYRSNKQYTRLVYHSSGFKEQELMVIHSRNILKTWSAGIEFHRLGVNDFTPNSTVFHSQFRFQTWYAAPGGKYSLMANATWNTLKNKVNGGIANDSSESGSQLTNIGLKGIEVRLNDAGRNFRDHTFYLSQYYHLSSGKDSLAKPRIGIFQKTTFTSGSDTYYDQSADSSYYQHYYESGVTYDSLHFYDLRNRAGFILFPDDLGKNRFCGEAAIEHRWLTSTGVSDTSLQTVSLFTEMRLNGDSSQFKSGVAGYYCITGKSNGDYSLRAEVESPELSMGRVQVSAAFISKQPDLYFNQYHSNHFKWNHSFKNSRVISAKIMYILPEFRCTFSGEISQLSKYLYFGEDANPQQYSGDIRIMKVMLIKNFTFRWLHLENEIYFQQVNQRTILHLPGWVTSNSLYSEHLLFRKALVSQFGFNLHYNSSYRSDRFMPATGIFYLQNDFMVKGYPAVDLFLNLKIKTARLFFKIENIGAGITANNYFMEPGYPMPGRVFKLGVNWSFYDL